MFRKGSKIKYFDNDEWRFGVVDSVSKSKLDPAFDICYVTHISEKGNIYFKICFLSEIKKA